MRCTAHCRRLQVAMNLFEGNLAKGGLCTLAEGRDDFRVLRDNFSTKAAEIFVTKYYSSSPHGLEAHGSE